MSRPIKNEYYVWSESDATVFTIKASSKAEAVASYLEDNPDRIVDEEDLVMVVAKSEVEHWEVETETHYRPRRVVVTP